MNAKINAKLKKSVTWVLAGAACVAGILLVAPMYTDQPPAPDSRAATQAVSAAAANGDAKVQPASANPWFDVAPSGNGPAMVSPLSTMSPPVFAADSRGKLVLNADTHANLEKLLLEENPDTLRANLDKAASTLPPQATAELKVLLAQFQQYAKALTHTIPPDNAPETEQERLKLLDKLHTLRVSYFGPEATQGMFGEEEATTRKLIGLMAAQDDPHLTSQQKADRAQEVLSTVRLAKPPPPG